MRKKSWRRKALLLAGVLMGTAVLSACQSVEGGSAVREEQTVGDAGFRQDPPQHWSKQELRDTVLICLVRHGQTVANAEEILADGSMDSPLTDQGKAEALRMGKALAEDDFRFDFCYASGLGRAMRTAGLILKGDQDESVHAQAKHGLNDVLLGKAAGRRQEEVLKEFGENAIAEYTYSVPGDGFESPLGAEDKLHFVRRFDRAMTEVAEESLEKMRIQGIASNRGPQVLVAAHSSAAFWLSWKFPSSGVTNLDNVSATVLLYRNGQWYLRYVNELDYDNLASKLTELWKSNI
uniref:histidine phosphatase family protein n=1 Tax=Eubacterium cellulosolvens TaxID=29322 RepID=UPI00048499BA|nr:histidine phosphatase family protein [[Eubacterium] cellulosolvens]